MKSVRSVEEYILQNEKWEDALILLHEIIISTELKESIKWGGPVYTYESNNIVGLAAFKAHVALWFFQGVFLKDANKLLVNAQDGTTKAMRQLRFSDSNVIDSGIVKEYVLEAIENSKQGLIFKPTTNKELTIPAELEKAFIQDKEIENCFNKFTLAKRREFAFFISSAKREETRLKRLDKIIPLILSNEGLNDKYK